jgi:hypothetical protein
MRQETVEKDGKTSTVCVVEAGEEDRVWLFVDAEGQEVSRLNVPAGQAATVKMPQGSKREKNAEGWERTVPVPTVAILAPVETGAAAEKLLAQTDLPPGYELIRLSHGVVLLPPNGQGWKLPPKGA